MENLELHFSYIAKFARIAISSLRPRLCSVPKAICGQIAIFAVIQLSAKNVKR